MWARVDDARATLYAEPNRESAVVAELAQGQEIEITELAPTGGGASWIAVVGPNDLRGYLPGETALYRYHVLRLAEETNLRVEASEASSVLVRYGRGAALLLVGSETRDGRRWLKLRDGDGREGFVPDETRFAEAGQIVQARAMSAAARRNMLVGGLWCGGGAAVTVATYAAASGGGTYVVAWGAIIFGGLQFVKGLAQYLGA